MAIPLSNWLWRHVVFSTAILFFHLFSTGYFILSFNSFNFSPPKKFMNIVCLIQTTIFVITTFCITFKKAINGTFGYDEIKIIKAKFQIFGVMTFFFLILSVFGIIAAWSQASSFILFTATNSLCCVILARTYSHQIQEIQKYLHAVTMANSHNGLTLSVEEAHICCQLDVERTKIQSILMTDHLSRNVDPFRNVDYYYMMRWLHKLRLLMTSDEREKIWRVSELCNEIQTHAASLQLDEKREEDFKKLANQPLICFPFKREISYENKDFVEELENVD